MSAEHQRRHSRTELVLRVDYERPANLLQDYITNLGEGGVFIATSLPLAIGQPLEFSLSFPGLLEPINLAGVVRWRRAQGSGGPVGVGVEFVFPDQRARQQVNRLLASIREADPGSLEVERPFNVLVVEDNEFVLEMLTYAMQRFLFDRSPDEILALHQSTSGLEALEILGSTRIDLAIIDHFLPGMTGCELIERVRADTRNARIPLLMVSVGGDTVRRDALNRGASLYLDKPVVLRQLLSTFDALIPRRQVENE